MLYQYLRLFYSDNGTLSDKSLDNQDEDTTIPFTENIATEDYLYIAKYYPFNNFFVKVSSANAVSSTLAIQYYDGTTWRDAVDILDGTASGGKTLARSGVVQFSPNRNYNWNKVEDTTNNNAPDELSGVTIYNCYWLRIRWSANLTSTTALDTVSYSFSRSQRLNNLDISINDYLTSFSATKTNWDDEVMTASLHVVSDMKSRGIIVDHGQVLRFDDVSLATEYKALALIFNSLGKSYVEKVVYYEAKYKETTNAGVFTIDKNNNAQVDTSEINSKHTTLVR
jgi:hypothetical protein